MTETACDFRWWPVGWLMHALLVLRLLKKAIPQGPLAVKKRVETGRTVRPRRASIGQPQLKPAGT